MPYNPYQINISYQEMTPEIQENHAILESILQSDPFNVYCVDCKKNLSDHASITFGIFICQQCASDHIRELGMDKSYIKHLKREAWDSYQLQFMLEGGNKKYYEFITEYKIQEEPTRKKYEHRAS